MKKLHSKQDPEERIIELLSAQKIKEFYKNNEMKKARNHNDAKNCLKQ